MKTRRIDKHEEDLLDVIVSKLRNEKGTLPNPCNTQNWIYNFASVWQFAFSDFLYKNLVGSEEYATENLKSLKSYTCINVQLYLCNHGQANLRQILVVNAVYWYNLLCGSFLFAG